MAIPFVIHSPPHFSNRLAMPRSFNFFSEAKEKIEMFLKIGMFFVLFGQGEKGNLTLFPQVDQEHGDQGALP